MMKIFSDEEEKKIKEFGKFADKLFEEINKDEDKAGAIACYFASPRALREQYKLETGENAIEQVQRSTFIWINKATDKYVEWLEGKLCKVKSE